MVTEPCNHYHCNSGTVPSSQKQPPRPPPPSPGHSSHRCSVSMGLPVWTLPVNGIAYCEAFCARLFRVRCFRAVHVAACIGTSFLQLGNILLHKHTPSAILHLAVTTNSYTSIRVQFLCIFNSLEYIPRVELLDHTLILFSFLINFQNSFPKPL